MFANKTIAGRYGFISLFEFNNLLPHRLILDIEKRRRRRRKQNPSRKQKVKTFEYSHSVGFEIEQELVKGEPHTMQCLLHMYFSCISNTDSSSSEITHLFDKICLSTLNAVCRTDTLVYIRTAQCRISLLLDVKLLRIINPPTCVNMRPNPISACYRYSLTRIRCALQWGSAPTAAN